MNLEDKERALHALRNPQHPQTSGRYARMVGGHIATCALGQIAVGYGWKPTFGGSLTGAMILLADHGFDADMRWAVGVRNDRGATYEQIADWLDRTIEPDDDIEAEAPRPRWAEK